MSDLPRETGVFVIGGGPAGLAAAIAARQRGFDVTLADCSVPPIDKACGEGIMPDGIAAARALGLDLERSGAQPFRGIRFCAEGTHVEAPFPHGYGLGLRRTTLHRLMAARAAECGVRLAWGTRVSGICKEGVYAGGTLVRSRWIVGADGGHSRVRRWAGLDACERDSRRFGFRRHYRVAPWSDFMELHWGSGCQLYITPVGPQEVCAVLISSDQRLRLEDALPSFPGAARRLPAAAASLERGGVSATRRLHAVARGNVALVGDASGSVDAITGEGLCQLFQHAVALASAMEIGKLAAYQAEHRRIGRRPELMSGLMLLIDHRDRLRRRTLRAMAKEPRVFERLLAMHVGPAHPFEFVTNGLALGWQMLTV